MLQKTSHYFLLLVALLLVSCEGNSDSESSTSTAGIDETAVVDIEIINTRPEFRVIKTEETEQPNCGGTDSIENEVRRSRAITHIIELGSEFTVSAEGSVGISGTNVQLGTSVASHLNYSYGTEEILERSVVVKAAPGSHMMHTIEQQEIWDVGEAIITINGQETTVPFSFRRDFAIQAVTSRDLRCPPEGESTLPEISTDTPAPPTNTPTNTPAPNPPTVTPTPNPPINTPTPNPPTVTPTPVPPPFITGAWSGRDGNLIITVIKVEIISQANNCKFLRYEILVDNQTNDDLTLPIFGGFTARGSDARSYEGDNFGSDWPREFPPNQSLIGIIDLDDCVPNNVTSMTITFSPIWGSFDVESVTISDVPIP